MTALCLEPRLFKSSLEEGVPELAECLFVDQDVGGCFQLLVPRGTPRGLALRLNI